LADLIVCNPPWIPAKANSTIEHAVYDPDSKMLKGCLSGLRNYLAVNGEAWLILSDLAEHLELRTREELEDWIKEADLKIVEKIDTAPKHKKAKDASDPLHAVRSKEITSLYRLQRGRF
ncbi:MAG TPA: methyltransferase, partial [Methylophilaceae bacterium]|nr:methyltransferase [Methylophilaceae bacterium]